MGYFTAQELAAARNEPKPVVTAPKSNTGGVRGLLSNVARGVASPFEYLINASIVNPGREIAAQVTGNKVAARNAERASNRNLGLGDKGTDLEGGLKKFIGNSAQALLTPASIGGAGIKGAVATGAAAGGASALTERDSNLEDVLTGAVAGGATGGALKAGGGVLSKLTKGKKSLSNAGQSLDASTSGVQMGQTLKGGRHVTPEYEAQLLDFKNNGAKKYLDTGIKAGKPRSQAIAAQEVHKAVSKRLSDTLDSINRDLGAGDKLTLKSGIEKRLAEDLGLDGAADSTIFKNALRDIEKAKDLKDLEKLRRKADDLAFKENGGKGSTEKAAQADHIRDAIDEFITPESPEYKAIKGDWRLSKDLLELTTKGSKNAKGATVPFAGIKVGTQAIPGVQSKGAGILNKLSKGIPETELTQNTKSARNFASGLIRQGSAAAAGNAMVPDEVQVEPDTTIDSGALGQQAVATTADDILAQQGASDNDPYSAANIQATARSILAQGGTQKDVAEFLANAKMLNEIGTAGGTKPLNSTASGVIADTKTGLQALQQLQEEITSSSANNPVTGRIRGSNPLDTSAQSLQASIATTKQIVGKALEGGVLRKEDEVKYAKLLPTMGDTDANARNKIQKLTELISSRLMEYQRNIGAGSGGTDLAGLGL